MFKKLVNPKFNIESDETLLQKIKFLFKSYLISFFCTILSVAIITVIDTFIVKILHQNSLWNEIRNSNSRIKFMFGKYSYLMIAVIIPLIEEIIFRLPLNLKKSSNFLTHFLDLTKKEDVFKIIITVIIFFTLFLLLNQKKLDNLRKNHFRFVFYFIAISFGLIHIINFHNINYFLILLYPFFVLPQFFMGILIGNIRIKYGFIWGWALHCLINSTSFLLP